LVSNWSTNITDSDLPKGRQLLAADFDIFQQGGISVVALTATTNLSANELGNRLYAIERKLDSLSASDNFDIYRRGDETAETI